MRSRTMLVAVLAALAAACAGGDVTPTDPAGNGGQLPDASPTPVDPGLDDPGGELEEPDPDEARPDEQPGIEEPDD